MTCRKENKDQKCIDNNQIVTKPLKNNIIKTIQDDTSKCISVSDKEKCKNNKNGLSHYCDFHYIENYNLTNRNAITMEGTGCENLKNENNINKLSKVSENKNIITTKSSEINESMSKELLDTQIKLNNDKKICGFVSDTEKIKCNNKCWRMSSCCEEHLKYKIKALPLNNNIVELFNADKIQNKQRITSNKNIEKPIMIPQNTTLNIEQMLKNDETRCVFILNGKRCDNSCANTCANSHIDEIVIPYCEEHLKYRSETFKKCSVMNKKYKICEKLCAENSISCKIHKKYDSFDEIKKNNQRVCSRFKYRGCTNKVFDHIDFSFENDEWHTFINIEPNYYNCDEKESKTKILNIIKQKFLLEKKIIIDNFIEINQEKIDKKYPLTVKIREINNKPIKYKINIGYYDWCLKCREKDQEKYQIKIKEDAKNFIKTETHKTCTHKRCGELKEIKEFIDEKNLTCTQCFDCRLKNKIIDSRTERGNHPISDEAKLKRKNKPKDMEKQRKYTNDSRERKKKELGLEEYHRIMNEKARIYRLTHPEYCADYEFYKNISKIPRYLFYKNRAKKENFDFSLDFTSAEILFNDECFYCGYINFVFGNGIDRLDNSKGYNISNCVTCCTVCNYIKNCLSPKVFLERVSHILSFNNMIISEENFINYDLFNDSPSKKKCHVYIKSAKDRNKEFKLTEDQFCNIIKNDCYICGKKNTKDHFNGIDRIDNNAGYFIDNCKACCSECNTMKNDFSHNLFMNKLIEIYENNKFENITKTNDDYKKIILDLSKKIKLTTIKHEASIGEEKENLRVELQDLRNENNVNKQKLYMLNMSDEQNEEYSFNHTHKILFLKQKYGEKFFDDDNIVNTHFEDFINTEEYLKYPKLICDRPTYNEYYNKNKREERLTIIKNNIKKIKEDKSEIIEKIADQNKCIKRH